MKYFDGCGTALITPFTKKGEVDYIALKSLVEHQITSGIDFLVPLGTTGEAACLSDQEKVKVLETIRYVTRGKTQIVAGVGSNNTQQVIANIGLLTTTGVDGFLVVTPYYNKPTQQGLYNHFQSIAAATKLPLIPYNVPSRTGVNMSAQTCLRLAQIKNIVGIKEASSNYSQISAIIAEAPRNFTILSGNDNETLSLMATGAHGVISVASNIAPRFMSNLVQALFKNNFTNARKLHHQLQDLFTNCFIETNPIPVKAGLAAMGLISNTFRPPLYAATPNTLALMRRTIKHLGL